MSRRARARAGAYMAKRISLIEVADPVDDDEDDDGSTPDALAAAESLLIAGDEAAQRERMEAWR